MAATSSTSSSTAAPYLGAAAVAAAAVGLGMAWRGVGKGREGKDFKGSSAGRKREVAELVRPNIRALVPYRCARDDYDQGVLLDANENSIGATVESPPDARELNRYPDPYQWALKSDIATLRGVRKEQIFLGVGSDEAIDMVMRIFCTPRQDSILITPPTYGMYKVSATVNDVNIQKAPLTPSFDLDIEGLFAAVDSTTKIIFLCSPGNPTAKSIPLEVVEAVLSDDRYDGMVVVDEAYVDFSSHPSACKLISRYPKLIVMQTLSKAFGLAGIRLGMAMSNEEVISHFNNMKAPYNISKLTAEFATAAFRNLALMQANVKTLLEERERVAKALAAFSFVKCIHPSDTNFLLVQIPKAKEVYKQMADSGVVIRYRGSEMHCTDCVRITIGTPQENDLFLSLLQKTAKSLGVQ